MPQPPKNLRDFEALKKIVQDLRGPDGCPWDKEQTHASLTRYAIEEIFELVEALDQGEMSRVKDELGDVLFQVMLHSELARQAGQFDVMDVIENLVEKMVRRHPHVFGDTKVSGSSEVLKNWAEIKASEAGARTKPVFDFPSAMPALLAAVKIGDKTKKLKFDWSHWQDVLAKVEEEINELQMELEDPYFKKDASSLKAIEHEIGDVLFSVAQLARHLGVDPEQALRKTNQRFISRHEKMRKLVSDGGADWDQMSDEQKEKFWQKAKKS